MYKVEIDRSSWSGFGACAELAPDESGLDEDGRASVRVGSTIDPLVREAAAAFPTAAITVYEEEAA